MLEYMDMWGDVISNFKASLHKLFLHERELFWFEKWVWWIC